VKSWYKRLIWGIYGARKGRGAKSPSFLRIPSQQKLAGQQAGDHEGAQAFWAVSLPELFQILGTTQAGLGSEEARGRLQRPGILAPHHRRTELVILLRQFATPITFILLAATVLSARRTRLRA
jgi:hypothetical protein